MSQSRLSALRFKGSPCWRRSGRVSRSSRRSASHGLARRLDRLRQAGYRVHIRHLWLPTAELALARVAEQVRAGGHDVPAEAVRRRFDCCRHNFFTLYRSLADAWRLYDATSTRRSELIAASGSGEPTRVRDRQAWRIAAEGFES